MVKISTRRSTNLQYRGSKRLGNPDLHVLFADLNLEWCGVIHFIYTSGITGNSYDERSIQLNSLDWRMETRFEKLQMLDFIHSKIHVKQT